MKRFLCGLAAGWLAAHAAAAAPVTCRLVTGLDASRPDGDRPQAWVAPAQTAPTIDGRVDEAAWSAAEPFRLGPLTHRGRAEPATEVRMMHGQGMLYVAVAAAEPDIGGLKREIVERDGPVYRDDSIELFLAPQPSGGYFQMIVGAGGAVYDRVGHEDARAWDAGARVKTAVGRDGWTLELAIPLKALGVGDKPPTHWRANVYRNRHAVPDGALQAWSPTPSGNYDRPETFGHLYLTPESPWAKHAAAGCAAGVVVEDLDGGKALLRIDLSAVPRGAKVYRARLLAERRPIAEGDDLSAPLLQGLLQAPAEGETVQIAGGPLALAGPDLDAFDVTRLAADWVRRGVAAGGVLVQRFPGWRPERTAVEIAFEGEPTGTPAQVAGLKAVHRAGQTFLTWADREDAFGEQPVTWEQIRGYFRVTDPARRVRYRVYRHSRPITSANVTEAVLIAEVQPLSAFNVNGWSIERLINQVVFGNDDQGEFMKHGPFDGWNRDSAEGGRLVIPRLAIEDGKPLPAGTGLCVHSAAAREAAYYAVTAVADGVENLSDFSAANSLAAPVAEERATWQPIEQPAGKAFGFDFRGTRHFFVRWVGPPLAPRPMYFNWSVLVPPGCSAPAPVELVFHDPGYSCARPPAKYLEHSIQICPHDFPFSGWYGFNDAVGTLKTPANGRVQPYTILRIESFLGWAQGRWPVDPKRIIAVGGDGAALFALHRPRRIAYVLITGFQSLQLDPKAHDAYVGAWGPLSKICDADGRGGWQWGEPDVLLCNEPMPRVVPKDAPPPPPCASAPWMTVELPLFICRGYSWGRDPAYGHGRGRFYYALQSTRHGLCAHWAWGGNLPAPEKQSGLWRGLDLTNTTAFPAITYSSADAEGEGGGQQNAGYEWKDVSDTPAAFEVTISGPESTFQMTPRRLSAFRVPPGQTVAWTAEPVETGPSWSRREKPEPASGTAVVDANGLIVVPDLRLGRGWGLKIRITKAE